jgi:hypothetical protein
MHVVCTTDDTAFNPIRRFALSIEVGPQLRPHPAASKSAALVRSIAGLGARAVALPRTAARGERLLERGLLTRLCLLTRGQLGSTHECGDVDLSLDLGTGDDERERAVALVGLHCGSRTEGEVRFEGIGFCIGRGRRVR